MYRGTILLSLLKLWHTKNVNEKSQNKQVRQEDVCFILFTLKCRLFQFVKIVKKLWFAGVLFLV
jgi:hypothetical protein